MKKKPRMTKKLWHSLWSANTCHFAMIADMGENDDRINYKKEMADNKRVMKYLNAIRKPNW